MRVILLTDLHIKPESTIETVPWVKHLCLHLRCNYAEETLIFVLGDIVHKGGENKSAAFNAADRIFSNIKKELNTINYQLYFLPGNHDYCDGGLESFRIFCMNHQDKRAKAFDFSKKKAWNYTYGEVNFILTDSIQDGEYKQPGKLDISEISACLEQEKINILLLHHSLYFEGNTNHAGVINQPEVLSFLKNNNIKYVFHGHIHATSYLIQKDAQYVFGLGSIGVEQENLKQQVNEQEQFLEVRINGKYVEVVNNWLYRSGMGSYKNNRIYPEDGMRYGDRSSVTPKTFSQPERYIKRHIMSRALAVGDDFIRYFREANKTSLSDVCKENTHVLLIADAGLGKSVEMENLAYIFSKGNPYVLPILMPLNVYNRESIQNYIHIFAPEYETLNPDQFLLIMDGYDEVADAGDFRRNLKHYITKNPNVRICVSMRSNFLMNESELFSDFAINQLMELEDQDIVDELRKQSIESNEFFYECKQKGLANLLSNPFYLNGIIKIYLNSKELPVQSEIIESMIELLLLGDSSKYEYTFDYSLVDNKHDIMRALTRLAYGMQLLNIYSLDEKSYQELMSNQERNLLRANGLLINTPNGHMFSHNNFREYLVAKELSKNDSDFIIAQISIGDTNYLNHNWLNILGLVLQTKFDIVLVDWLAETEPLALTKLEPSQVDEEVSYIIFERTLSDIICRNIWFHNGTCTVEELATFSQSKKTLELILRNIAMPEHFRGLYFCLDVLSSFTQLYGMDEQIRKVLVECYQSDNIRPNEKRIAIYAIARLGLATLEITTDLIARYEEKSSSNERLGIYDYLIITRSVNEHVNFLLSGLKCISHSHNNGEISNASEGIRLMECIDSIDAPEAICELISWGSLEENMELNIYDKTEVFSGIFKKAVNHYNDGCKKLFDIVYRFFVCASRFYYDREYILYCIDFFSDTGTIEVAFQKYFIEASDENMYVIDSIVVERPEIIDIFCRLYQEDKLPDPLIFERIAIRPWRTPEIFEKFSKIVKAKTGKEIKPPEPPVDYERLQKEDKQCFFNALFDKQIAEELLFQLLGLYDAPEITFAELRGLRSWERSYPAGTRTLELFLIQCKFTEEKVNNIFNLIKWEEFFVNQVHCLFEEEKKNKRIIINEEQLAVLTESFNHLESKINLHTAFTELDDNSSSLSYNLCCYMTLKEYLGLQSPDSYYLGLLEIPYFFVVGNSNVDEKYKYIEVHLSREKISERIKTIISEETRRAILDDLFFGCKIYRLNEGKDAAIRYCLDDKIPVFYRRGAFEYLSSQFELSILQELITNTDDAFFETIISIIEEYDDLLKKEIISRYQKTKSPVLLRKMLCLNMSEGLRVYIVESRKIGRPMETGTHPGELTETISVINDIQLLPLLIDTAKLRFSEGFEDKSYRSLYNSLLAAFRNCAMNDYDAVSEAINELKEEMSANLECVGFCSIVLDSLQESHIEKLMRTWTMPEVKAALTEMGL